MRDFNEPAFASPDIFDASGNLICVGSPGLTIRQTAVLMAMQGLLANPAIDNARTSDVAIDAVEYADAVLKREAETR